MLSRLCTRTVSFTWYDGGPGDEKGEGLYTGDTAKDWVSKSFGYVDR